MKFFEFTQDDYKIHDREFLDRCLVELTRLVIEGQNLDPEKFGMVAACVLDPKRRAIARTSMKINGKWVHAERNAMDSYEREYGEIPEGSIILTTLSPCDNPMTDRYSGSCTDYINQSPVKKVYCGYHDPSQHDEDFDFTMECTDNRDIRKLCKKLAWTFLGDEHHPVNENLHKWFKEKWVRFGPDGKIRGDCARGDDSEGKPKCLPQAKAHALGKKNRASAAARKRRKDPNPERHGSAINVATKKKSNEAANPAQQGAIAIAMKKAHKKPRSEGVAEGHHNESCPHCGGPMFNEELMNEKKDACYYKVKSRYKVWPSAYASGALVRCRKKGSKNWGSKSESIEETWSEKYKRSIDCANPKGFSQRAHCAGKKMRREMKENQVEIKGVQLNVYTDGQNIDVRAMINGKQIGYVIFERDGKNLVPLDLAIDKEYRGKGIAKIIYDYIKTQDFKISRSPDQTTAGKQFWDKNRGVDGNVWEQQVEHKIIKKVSVHLEENQEDDEDNNIDHSNLPSVLVAKNNINKIIAKAQQDYDNWDESDRDTYAGGGICHIIADSICDVLSSAGIDCSPVSSCHEQHVYVAAKFKEGVYSIDIPYHVYETGGGFSWKKLPDVKFDPGHVVFYRVSGDPADFEAYTDSY